MSRSRPILIAVLAATTLLGTAACVPPVGAIPDPPSTTPYPTSEPDPTTSSGPTTTAPTSQSTPDPTTDPTTGPTTTTTTTPITTTLAPPAPTTPPTSTSADPPHLNGVPAPGQVGFLGDPTSLKVIDGSGSAPAGTTWTAGALRISSADVTLDGVFVKGGIDWSGSGTLTIRNSIVEGAAPAWSAILTRRGHIDVRDTTIRWRGPAPGPTWGNGAIHGDATMTVIRCDISGAPDGIQNGPGDSTFEENYIHGPALLGTYPTNTHNDGIQSYGGPGLVIRNNRIDIRDPRGRAYDGTHQNGAVFIQPSGGDSSTAPQVVGNYLVGGGYTLRLEGPMSGAVVTDNVFGPTTGGFGSTLADKSGVDITRWSGNVTEQGNVVPEP